MIILGAKRGLLGAAGYEPEAKLLFSRMAAQPTNSRKRLINKTIRALKRADVWPAIDGIYFIASHTLQAGLLNWKYDKYDLKLLSNGALPPTSGHTVDRGYAAPSSASANRVGTPDLRDNTAGIQWSASGSHLMSHVVTN